MTAVKPTPSRTLNLYKSYSFVDKDPVVDLMRTGIENSGESYKSLSEKSGVSVSTLYSWFHLKTRMPRMATIAAVGSVLGYEGYNWQQRRFIGGKLRLVKSSRKEPAQKRRA